MYRFDAQYLFERYHIRNARFRYVSVFFHFFCAEAKNEKNHSVIRSLRLNIYRMETLSYYTHTTHARLNGLLLFLTRFAAVVLNFRWTNEQKSTWMWWACGQIFITQFNLQLYNSTLRGKNCFYFFFTVINTRKIAWFYNGFFLIFYFDSVQFFV